MLHFSPGHFPAVSDWPAVPVAADEAELAVRVDPPDDPVEARVAEVALDSLAAAQVKDAAVALEQVLLECAREADLAVNGEQNSCTHPGGNSIATNFLLKIRLSASGNSRGFRIGFSVLKFSSLIT